MGNDSTPHKVARLKAQRNDGTMAQMKIAKPCDANINKVAGNNIAIKLQFNGNL